MPCHLVLQRGAFLARLRKLLLDLRLLRLERVHRGGMAAVGLRELVAGIDEGHEFLELGLFLRELAFELLERAGLDREVRLGGAHLLRHRALLDFERFQRDGAIGMLRPSAAR